MNHSLIALVPMVALLACSNSADPTEDSSAAGIGNTSQPDIGGCLSKTCGPTTDEFFDNTTVANLRLTFTKADLAPFDAKPSEWFDLLWEKWNSHCGPYEWLPVNMVYEPGDGGKSFTLNKVGIRLRGSKSRGANPLAGFKLDFNQLLPSSIDRRFADLSRVEVLSNEKDPASMVQCLTYKLMRDFGLEAPRCNHLRVFVNDELYGVVESVERGKDNRYLEHHYGTKEGSLYAASASCGYGDSLADLEYKGAKFADEYLLAYEMLKGKDEEAEANLIPFLKCGDNVETPDDEDFKACISEWIDVEDWLKLIAAESLTPTVEDFVGARRNFFLYFQPDEAATHGGKMRVWGWDYDTALERQLCYPGTCDPFTAVTSWYGPRGTRAKLVVRLTRVYKKQYCEQMNRFLDTVYLPEAVDDMASVIEPFMQEDPTYPFDEWQTEVSAMREYMIKHKVDMKAVISAACSEDSTVTEPDTGAAGAGGQGDDASATAGAGGASH